MALVNHDEPVTPETMNFSKPPSPSGTPIAA
jgi:hypothetical protein